MSCDVKFTRNNKLAANVSEINARYIVSRRNFERSSARQTNRRIHKCSSSAQRYSQTSLTKSLVTLQSDMLSNNVSKTSAEFYQCQSLLYKVFAYKK